MTWTGLKTVAMAAFAALVLAGCYQAHHKASHPPKVTAATAKQVCEIDTLAREHRVAMVNLEPRRDESDTIAMEKLKAYRGEVDASYRFVVEHCNNYNMCMQAHDYNEPKCDSSRASWTESHRKFNELTEKLAKIEAHHSPGHRPSKPPRPRGGCNCDEVFTTGCCNENY